MTPEMRYFAEARLVGWLCAHPEKWQMADGVQIDTLSLRIILDEIRARSGKPLFLSPRFKGLMSLDENPVELADHAGYSKKEVIENIVDILMRPGKH
jgi:hypothetical protein